MRNKENESEWLSGYNDAVDYINQWDDTYYKAANDIEELIDKYYDVGSLKSLHPFYNLLDEMRKRSETHAQIVDLLHKRLKSRVQELL